MDRQIDRQIDSGSVDEYTDDGIHVWIRLVSRLQKGGWTEQISKYMHINVFDKIIWHTIGPKSILFGTEQLSLWADGAVNYDYIVTNSINSLLAQNVFPMAHSLTIVEPIWLMLQKLSKTLMYMNQYTVPNIIKFTYYHCTSIDYSVQ